MSGEESLEGWQESAGPRLLTGWADAHRDLENLGCFYLVSKEALKPEGQTSGTLVLAQ